VAKGDVTKRIRRRATRAGLTIAPDVLLGLEAYLSHLTLWNRKINLTSLGLEPLTDHAVDRLLMEPLSAARHVRPGDRLAIDVGSGGGSPAIPLRLASPGIRMVLVESKVRKSAFLREVVRQLSLQDVEVANLRFEELLSRPDLHEAADLVTFRAVRAQPNLWTGIQAFLKPEGRVFWFGSGREPAKQQPLIMPFAIKQEVTLVASTGSRLSILERR
jgi:16S rRNA (guanine527-N7)-methyltransferase